jgi:hypothetical protein
VKIENGKHVLIPEAAEAVRTIYRLAAAGWSTPRITRHFNEKKVPAIGRKGVWVRSYVQKILTDRSVLGEYQPTKGRNRKEIDGEPIADYWPAVVSLDLWEKVRAGMTGRATRESRRRKPARVAHPFQGLLTDALDRCGMYTITYNGRKYVVSQRGYDDPRGDTNRRTFPVDVLQSALLSRMRELESSDLFTDPTTGSVAAAIAKLATIDKRLKVAVDRFEADPESRTWADKVDEYERERRAAEKELADVRAEAANPLPTRWQDAVQAMGDEEPERLRQILAGIITDIRILIVKRGQTRACASQVFFAGGAVRSYLIQWTRCVSLPRCKRPESVQVRSFAEAPVPAKIDLRKPADAAAVEKTLMKHLAQAGSGE